jgi:hypothetical protein
MKLLTTLALRTLDMASISWVVWGDMAWVNFVSKVIGVDMGFQ